MYCWRLSAKLTTLGLLIAACSGNLPSASPPEVSPREELTPLSIGAPTPQSLDSDERLFRNDPTQVTIFDVALALAYTFPGVNTPEEAVQFANSLLSESVAVSELQPEPTPEQIAAFAAPTGARPTITDVAVLLALTFPGVDTPEKIADFVNGLLGSGTLTSAEVLILGPLPGSSPSPSTSPSPSLSPSPGVSPSPVASPSPSASPSQSPSPSPSPVAGTNTPISVGQTLNGTLEIGDEVEPFETNPASTRLIDRFSVVSTQPGQGLTISLTSPDFIPAVSIVNGATGELVGNNTNTSGSSTTSLDLFVQSGVAYDVLVTSRFFSRPSPQQGSYSLTVTEQPPGVPGFQIDIVYLDTDAGSVPANIRTLVEQAALRWQTSIVQDVPDVIVSLNPGQCNIPTNGQGIVDRPVDDLLLLVRLDSSIQAPVLATGGPCRSRGPGLPTIIGQVNLGSALLSSTSPTESIRAVVTHEIGHVLGIGSTNLRDQPTIIGNRGPDPRLISPNALSQYQLIGGIRSSIPLEPVVQGHWRGDNGEAEDFGSELMTPSIRLSSGEVPPLSRMTLGFLQDLNYTVDLSTADSYTVPPIGSRHGVRSGEVFLDLTGDYIPLPEDGYEGFRLR